MPKRINRKWLRHTVLPALAVALLLALAACYPGGPESASDTDLTLTVQTPEGDYTNLRTFAMENTVHDLTPPGVDPADPIPQTTKDLILNTLRDEMAKAGFTEVDTAATDIDTWVLVGAVQSEVWFYYYGWGGWYGGYYPHYGNVSSFDVGSVVWQMMDTRNYDPASEDPPPSLWLAAVNGALSNSSSTTTTRLVTNIQQAFTQSPYIKATPATP